MTDMIKAVADAIKKAPIPIEGQPKSMVFHGITTPCERIAYAKAATEAARPYIIAEYNERLLSDEAIVKAVVERAYTEGNTHEIMRAAIKAAIKKAGE